MGWLLTAAETRLLERGPVATGATTIAALMERAGRAVADAAFEAWPELREGARRAVVVCGPGNNGGDGFVVARLLAEAGLAVDLLQAGDFDATREAAPAMRRRWLEIGPVHAFDRLPALAPGADLVVDALFGFGLTRPMPENIRRVCDSVLWRESDVIERGEEAGPEGIAAALAADDAPFPRVLAVDCPSGLCLDTGRDRGVWLDADVTVTFHAPKRGHFLADGPDRCGRLVVADLGLERGYGAMRLIEAPDRVLAKTPAGHKYDHGHALVLAGGAGRGGAARLAARAALRVGAGLVTVGAPGEAMAENAARLDAIMLRRIDGSDDLAAALADERIGVVVLGPGLGVGARTRDLVATACRAEPPRRLVLDADALTSFEGAPAPFPWAPVGAAPDRAVLTPHAGEFRRLFPTLDLAPPDDGGPLRGRAEAVADAAALAGATVLLKGRDTVIATPGIAAPRLSLHGACHGREAPWLATAGAGDVLAGLIAGLLARGFDPHAAAETAAWLHVEAARAIGPGLIAEDLPEALPGVLRRLGA